MLFILAALIWAGLSIYALSKAFANGKAGRAGSSVAFFTTKRVLPTVAVTGIALFLAFSIIPVSTSKIAVGKSFGKTYASLYTPGVHLQAPWNTVERYFGVPLNFVYDGDVISGDKNPLWVSVGFTTKINERLAWRLQETLGTEFQDTLLVPAGQTAVRRGIAEFPWNVAATGDRNAVEQAIQREFTKIIVEQMLASGLTEREANTAFTVFPVQLRQSKPDPKVSNAVAEKTAAIVDLERQETLTEIAAQEALRRKNEGEGVKNLFTQLPEGFTAAEIADVLTALATKVRSDAMLKAVETGQVGTIIMNGDTAGSPAVSVTPRPKAAE